MCKRRFDLKYFLSMCVRSSYSLTCPTIRAWSGRADYTGEILGPICRNPNNPRAQSVACCKFVCGIYDVIILSKLASLSFLRNYIVLVVILMVFGGMASTKMCPPSILQWMRIVLLYSNVTVEEVVLAVFDQVRHDKLCLASRMNKVMVVGCHISNKCF